MGSTNYSTRSKPNGFRAKSGSIGSDKEMNGKLKRTKIRRPAKMNDYGLKRIPDYTELAYKEAVSKLRYFLSGNYAPSVRSYGGSTSIKNLDESDGDLDKKYSSPYNALSEFKPRPRLTAKYTTLYADSLKNYTPEPTNNASQPPTTAAADITGGTNPDVVNFIQKQEEYIEQLERESQYCRDELNNLLGKVKEVISENEHLHDAQKNKLISRMFHTYGSETDELDDAADSTGLDSDNKVSPSKTRKSMKTRTTKLEGPNIVFESRIAELEAQLTQAKIDLKKVQEENNENKRKLASGLVDSTCLDGFKRQIDNLQRDKSSLESQISKLKLSLEQREDDSGKYKRSDALEQQLREERNNLEIEVRRLKDELSQERSKVRELAGEGARRAVQERSAAEQRYHAHFDQLEHDLAAQYDNVAKLQLEMERQRREDNDLKRELSMKNSAVEELKMEIKNKTATLQADLAQAHAEKASLEEELASARLAMERQQRQAKHETNRLNSEIQSLRQRLDRADADLVHSRRENLRLTEQIANLEKELNMKHLTPISPEKNKKEKELSTMFESMENKHAKTVAELEAMIHSQNSLMEKLTGECRLLTDKLDDANRRHKEELGSLQRQVETLGRSLQPTHASPSTYQAPPTHMSTANRIPHTTPDTRRNHTGDDSTSNSAHDGLTELQNSVPGQTIKRDDYGIIGHLNNEQQRPHETEFEEQITDYSKENSQISDKNKHEDINEGIAMELEQSQIDANNYGFEQNYEQSNENTEFHNDYDQNYEQPAYTEEHYNYEQYPQQYTNDTDPNSQYQSHDPNSQYQSNNPDSQHQNIDPNSQYQSHDPNSQYQSNDPNSQYQNNDPNTQYQSHDPNSQYQSNDPDSQYQNNDPNSQYQSRDPDSQYQSKDDPQLTHNYETDNNYQGDVHYGINQENAQYSEDNTLNQQISQEVDQKEDVEAKKQSPKEDIIQS